MGALPILSLLPVADTAAALAAACSVHITATHSSIIRGGAVNFQRDAAASVTGLLFGACPLFMLALYAA